MKEIESLLERLKPLSEISLGGKLNDLQVSELKKLLQGKKFSEIRRKYDELTEGDERKDITWLSCYKDLSSFADSALKCITNPKSREELESYVPLISINLALIVASEKAIESYKHPTETSL